MDRDAALKKLREEFPESHISLLPRPTKKENPKGKCPECGGWHGLPAIHLKYVGHAALTDRLLDVDPEWKWEPFATDDKGLPLFDESGGLWIKLTVLGITRPGYGHAEAKQYMDAGARVKEVIGDALRNAAMRFGAALDLWHKGDLHGDDDANLTSLRDQLLPVLAGAAGHGIEAYRSVWKSLSAEAREACKGDHEGLKAKAAAADAQNGKAVQHA